jgi:microcystin degradation protein MlrC|eukprot:COSAG06_NODE_2839_length_6196_cov_2.423487_6_plen_72_part_00
MVDPESAEQAAAAGVGATLTVELGGKSHERLGPPVRIEVEVLVRNTHIFHRAILHQKRQLSFFTKTGSGQR